MLCRKITLVLFIISILSICLFSQSDSLSSSCMSALQKDLKDKNSRDKVIVLINKIKAQETLYLKSALYPDIRWCYERLQAKLGDYYFEKGDFKKALECFVEADKYSDGYSAKLNACKERISGRRLLEEQDELEELKKRIKAGGSIMNDLEKIIQMAREYKQRYNKNTPWDACISFLEKYFKAKQENNYTALLDLYDAPNMMTSCSAIFYKWDVMSREKVIKDFLSYFQTQTSKLLGDKGYKSEPEFKVFMHLYNQVKKYLGKTLDKEWKIRYDCLKNYFEPKTSEDKKMAAKFLYTYFPNLAKSYSIFKPSPTKSPPTSHMKEKFPSGPSKIPDKDYEKLEKMWKEVKKMNTEQEVVEYILKRAELRTRGSLSAKTALDRLLKWHNQWNDLKPKPKYRLKALAMIARLQTSADNPEKQNEIYKYLLEHYTKKELSQGDSPDWKELNATIKNNNCYLTLYDAWKNRRTLDASMLKDIDKNLKYESLTLEQKIQAHYMLGALNENILRNENNSGNTLPVCYHYGRAYQLMNAYEISKIHLIWSKAFIEIDKLEEKACEHCMPIKKNGKAEIEFIQEYQNKDMDLEDLIRQCQGDLDLPKKKRKGHTTPTESQPENILKFMDTIFTFVKTSKTVDPVMQVICRQLVQSSLSGPGFNEIIGKYKNKIPGGYDMLMNQFFHIIYIREKKWKERAEIIIKSGLWVSDVKNKMRQILKEMKILFD